MNVDLTFSKNLKGLLRSKGITTAHLAEAVKVSAKTVSDWLAGRTPRDLVAVRRCAEHLGVSVHFLLYGDEDSKHSLTALLEKTEVHAGLYEIIVRKVVKRD